MKTSFLLFFILIMISLQARSQQTFNSLTVKDLASNRVIVTSTTQGSKPCPSMTEVQRDSIASPLIGQCIYNSTSLKLNVYNGSLWKSAGGGIENWVTAFAYAIGDVVVESNKIYQANTAHTSGVFATDLANWTQLANNVSDATGVLPLANGGTSKLLTASDGAIAYSDSDSLELLAAGTTGQFLKSNGATAPSWADNTITAKAQNGSPQTLSEIQVPNNSLTQTDTNKHLIETNNKNILSNPSFEHSTELAGWTSAGTEAGFSNPTVVIDGKKSIEFNPSSETINLTQSSPLYQAQFSDGVQGLAMVRIKSDIALSVCSIQAGTVSTTNCVTTRTDSKWGLYKIPFILGATSNGVSIASSGSVTGTVYIDDAFVGAVDLKQDVDQSRIAGESYFAGTTNCGSWTRTSTTIGAFATDTDCPGPTIAMSTMGTWATTDSDLPRQTVNNLPAGTYKAWFTVNSLMTAQNMTAFAINDGTTTCYAVQGSSDSADESQVEASCTFVYTSAGNRVFELYGASVASTITLPNARTSPASGIKFRLEYFGSSQVYTAQNADTDWGSCGHTTSDFTGFGTVSAIETQCKRDGGDLLMKGKFTSGIATAVEARLNLKLNSTTLTSKGVSVIPSIQIAGNSGSSSNGSAVYSVTLIEPSVSYITFGLSNGTVAPLTKLSGSTFLSNGQLYSFNARIPINGWENSNVIIGTFNEVVTSPGISKPKTCHYAFGGASATLAAPVECTTGTCIEVYDSCGTGTPPAYAATAIYNNLTFASGTFANSSYVDCGCVAYDVITSNVRECSPFFTTGTNSWAANSSGGYVVQLFASITAGTGNESYVQVTCKGQAP